MFLMLMEGVCLIVRNGLFYMINQKKNPGKLTVELENCNQLEKQKQKNHRNLTVELV